MAEDVTVAKNPTLRKDAEPPNSMDESEGLILPDGRAAPFRVECNVDEDMSLSVPAAEASITVSQRIRRRGDEQLSDSVQVLCGERDDGSVTVRVLIWTPKFPDGLQIALVTSRPGRAAADNDLIECDLGHKQIESLPG